MSTVERYGTLFPTAVVGSMPRPEFVRQIVLDGGSGDKDADGQRLDAAVAYAASLQSAAGLDIITDGEWRRASYVGVIAQLAHGFELGTSDDGRPWTVIVDKVEPKQPGTVAAEVAALRETNAEPNPAPLAASTENTGDMTEDPRLGTLFWSGAGISALGGVTAMVAAGFALHQEHTLYSPGAPLNQREQALVLAPFAWLLVAGGGSLAVGGGILVVVGVLE